MCELTCSKDTTSDKDHKLVKDFRNLFNAAQNTAACHQRNSLLLRNIYERTNLDTFWTFLLPIINSLLTTDPKEKNPYVDRLMLFIGQFCAAVKRLENMHSIEDDAVEPPIITKIFMYLLEVSKSYSNAKSFRACQLINVVLSQLIGFDVDSELYLSLQEVLTDRLTDCKANIRLQAITTLHHLQDSQDPDDRLIPIFAELLCDSNAKVRMHVVEKIALRNDMLWLIVTRTRDIEAGVRLAAFKRLSKLAKSLKIKGRRRVLSQGLNDTSPKIKNYICSEFLSSWWETYNNNILQLLKSLRLDADEKDVTLTVKLYEEVLNKFYFKRGNRSLKELFEVLPLNEERLLPYEQLNWESVTYWRVLVEVFAKNEELEEHVEKTVPEAVFVCRYVVGYLEHDKDTLDDEYLEKQYIIQQFFYILRTYDLGDPHSRQSLHRLVKFVLKREDLVDDTVEVILHSLEKTISKQEPRCRFALEIISDIMYPVDEQEETRQAQEKEFQLAQLTVQLIQMREDQHQALNKQDYLEAEKLKHEIEDLQFKINDMKNMIVATSEPKKTGDLTLLCKCLDIAWAMLRFDDVSSLTSSLQSMKSEFLNELLVNDNEIIRLKALRCYAICCILDKQTARQGIHIFAVPISSYQAGEECDTQILSTCISAVSDLVRIYGAGLLAEPNDLSDSLSEECQKVFLGGTTLTSLVQGLVELMDNEESNIRILSTVGLCKIVLDARIHSPPVISRLILKWCYPQDNDSTDKSLKQFIGHVLERIPHLPHSHDQLEKAVILTFDSLMNVGRNSPLNRVDVGNIGKFMLALCKLSPRSEEIQSNILLYLCRKLNENPERKLNPIFSKLLLTIEFFTDKIFLQEVTNLLKEAREYIYDKTVTKNVTTFLAKVNEVIGGARHVSVIEEESLEEEELGDED